MKYLSVVCALCVLVALTSGAPMPQNDQDNGVDTRTQTTQIVNGINNKIKLLRQYCPQLFQVIDNVIQNVTSTAFRVIGRVVLQSGALGIGGGGSSGGGGGGGGSRVSVVLPTFGPDDDDYDDEEDEEETKSNNIVAGSSTEASTSTPAQTTMQTIPSSTSDASDSDLDSNDIRIDDARDANDTALNDIIKDTSAPYTSPASETRSKRETVRTIRAAEDTKSNDQESAASGGNALNPSDDLANVEADDADRDKRFLPFGGSFGAHGSAGSAGGSGNFLFDIIRSTADGAARAAGTVYRMIAGTENVGLGFTATASSTRSFLPQLVAGSGATEESDEKDNAPAGPGGVAEIDVAKGGDGLTEGIPGPITRLFVLANRGLANLVQDLILRIASTSERIVNFKARLITALI